MGGGTFARSLAPKTGHFYIIEITYSWRNLDRAIESFGASARGFAANAQTQNEISARIELRPADY